MTQVTAPKNKISAIIPCFNAQRFLPETIELVLSQSRRVDEIFVVDDGSTDRSAEVARSCGATVISLGRNCGPGTARNRAVECAKGDFIAFLDADDYWNPNHCEVLCGLLEQYPDAAVAYSAARMFGTRSGIDYQSPRNYQPFDGFRESFCACIVSNSAVMWRSVYLELGGYDPGVRVAADYEFWLRTSQKHRFVSTPEITSNYRWHPSQISTAPEKQLQSVWQSRYRFLQNLRQNGEMELAEILEKEEVPAIWDWTLRSAWSDPKLLQVLGLVAFPSGDKFLGPRIWLRLRLLHVLKYWERARMRLGLRTRLIRVVQSTLRTGSKILGRIGRL